MAQIVATYETNGACEIERRASPVWSRKYEGGRFVARGSDVVLPGAFSTLGRTGQGMLRASSQPLFWRPQVRHASAGFVFAVAMAMPHAALAQAPWTVTLTPTLNPLPVGLCGAVQLTVMDPAIRDVPRNPQGVRVTLGDFDLSVSGAGAAGRYIDATHYEVCACQGGAAGATATVVASYPAQSLAPRAQIPGVRFQTTATFTLAAPKGPQNPLACTAAPAAAGAAASGNVVAVAGAGAAGTAVARAPAPGTPVAGTPAPAPGPSTPSGLTAVQIGPGEVRLSWQAIPNMPAYTLVGPGLPQTGLGFSVVQGAVTTTAQNVPSGNQTWSVGGIAGCPSCLGGIGPAPAEQQARVTLDVKPWAVTAATAVNPANFLAAQVGVGEVRLSWAGVSGVSYYVLLGPGLPQGGVRVTGATAYNAVNVPAGLQEWAIGSYYEPGPVSTAAAAFPRVSLNVTPPPAPPPVAAPPPPPAVVSGRYLVSVTGLKAFQSSVDDILSRDGVGDEVFAAAYVRHFTRPNAQIKEVSLRRSATYGDVGNNPGSRVQAGTRSLTGGIQDSDVVPAGAITAMRTVPAQDTTFPLRLWEGTLADTVDALVISPSLWEVDGVNNFFTQWNQQQEALNQSIFTLQSVQDQITQRGFGVLVAGAGGVSVGDMFNFQARTVADMALLQVGLPFVTLLQTTSDRPIGVVPAGDASVLPNPVVVLTREIIEAALAQPPIGMIPSPLPVAPGVLAPKPGVLSVLFRDGVPVGGVIGNVIQRPAIYQMFIQVERLP
jgi:hypothetical protein